MDKALVTIISHIAELKAVQQLYYLQAGLVSDYSYIRVCASANKVIIRELIAEECFFSKDVYSLTNHPLILSY